MLSIEHVRFLSGAGKGEEWRSSPFQNSTQPEGPPGMARNAVRLVVALLVLIGNLSLIACNYTAGPYYRREDIQGDSSAAVAEGTYTYCSGQYAAKCRAGGMSGFSPSVFKFATTLPDDGEGKAGGWQQATGTLTFYRWTSLLPETWSCMVTVGMPLRTELNGKISTQTAASVTAGVATQASFTVMGIKPEVPPGIFCFKFKEEMRSLLKKPPLDTYGARVP